MGRAELLQGIRMLRLKDVLSRWESSELSQVEAAEILGMSERSFRRWCRRWEEEGDVGLLDRRIGKPSPQQVPADRAEEMAELYRTRYAGFTAKHFHEHLQRDHGFRWGYSWTKTRLQQLGLVEKAPRKGAHRRKRPRRPLVGMMLHQDGSRHAWLAGDQALDLVITLDDATSEIYSAFLVEEEGTASSFRGLAETIARKGLPSSLYTDRGSHYFHTPKAGEAVDRKQLTQLGRALAQLRIEHIAAYSPQARGRCERAFGTLQDRLPKELALAGIADMAAANRFIAEVYLPQHNARFAVAPAQAGSAFVACPPERWRQELCVQEERKVAADNTVSWHRLKLQIPPSPERPHYVRATVRVHQHADGAIELFHGPRCIARYTPDGAPDGAPDEEAQTLKTAA